MAHNRDLLRKTLLQKRRALSAAFRLAAAQQLTAHFSKHALLASMQQIAFYNAHDGEIDPAFILEAAFQAGKTIYLPILDPDDPQQLLFAHYEPHDRCQPNRYGILEPSQPSHVLAPNALDCVLVPLVAFDKQGHRLGRGGGHYDRSFAFLRATPTPAKPVLIGLAYDFQRVESVTPAEWDVPLQHIVTEQGVDTPEINRHF